MDGMAGVAAVLEHLGLSSALLSPLRAHAWAVREASPRLGLVSTGDEAVVLSRHSADSLLFAAAQAPKPAQFWLDVGSGGGFPGLVLAICYPETQFLLVESNKKKAGFLDLTAVDLGLGNVRIYADRFERLQEGHFDGATARAVHDPPVMMAELRRHVKPDGVAMVAGTGTIPDARVFQADFSDVDSPGTVFIMGGLHE